MLCGCSGSKRPDGMPKLHPCQITITQDGVPLEGASVTLDPKGGSISWRSDGRTDANGVAYIVTGVEYKGAPVGEYRVRVSKMELSPSAVSETSPTDPVEYEKWAQVKRSETRTQYRMVKAEFDDPQKTTLELTVSEGKNEVTFDVGEAIKEEIKPKGRR